MRETLKALTKHSVVYGFGSLLSRVLAFVLLPIYTRYLTPADYGILSLLSVTGSIVGVVAAFGFGPALFREVIYRETDESAVESTALYFLLGESALLFGVFILFSSQLSGLLFGGAQYAHLLRLVFFSGLVQILNVVVRAKLRIHEQSFIYALLSVTRFLVGAGLNIFFIVVLHRGVEGLITAGLIAAVVFAPVHLFLLFRNLRMVFSVSILRRMLAYGVPMVPALLSSMAMTSADRYFLQYFSTTAEVGLYSLGYNIGVAMNLVVQAIQLAWPAHMFAIAKRPNAERELARLLTYYLAGIGFLGLGLSVLAREVLVIMTTPQFYTAYKVVPLIVLSYVLYGVRFMTNTALETKNKMKYVAPIIFFTAVLNLGLNYLFIPRYGMMGAAWATVISYFALVVIQTVVNLRFWWIPYEYGRMAKIFCVFGLLYGTSLLIKTPNAWLNGGLKLILLVTYPLLLYGLRFFDERETAFFKRGFHWGIRQLRTWGRGT